MAYSQPLFVLKPFGIEKMKGLNAALIILVLGAALGWVISTLLPTSDEPITLPNAVASAPTGGDFSLTSADGPFRLQDQRGKVVLIYFGYTFCSDICPTNLALMSQALNAMTDEELSHVQGLFISVDPERDKVETLKKYAQHFHDTMQGVTGSPAEIAEIAKRYGTAYRKVEGESEEGYTVDHASNTYIIAPDGSLHTILPHAAPSQEILNITRKLLAES